MKIAWNISFALSPEAHFQQFGMTSHRNRAALINLEQNFLSIF